MKFLSIIETAPRTCILSTKGIIIHSKNIPYYILLIIT